MAFRPKYSISWVLAIMAFLLDRSGTLDKDGRITLKELLPTASCPPGTC